MVDRYPTTAAFLAATRNGEIPEMLHQKGPLAGAVLARPVLNILLNEYGLDAKEYKVNNGRGIFLGVMLQNLTDHEFNVDDRRPINEFQDHQKGVPVALRDTFNKFAVQYDNALKEYVAAIQKQATEEQRKRDIEAAVAANALAKTNKVRQDKLAEILASPDYKQWEAAKIVQQGEKMISNAQLRLDHDDAVQRESGVTDLAARRAAGEQMVTGKKMVETAFGTYKKLGGKASNPNEVVAGSDPAAEYR